MEFTVCLPYVGGIIERVKDGRTEVLIQTRWKPQRDPLYSGTWEFPAGVMDAPFESVFETLKREIREETGLNLKSVKGESKTVIYSPNGNDAAFAFRPFCCTQQLKEGKPWVGFVFICEVEEGEIVSQESEAKDAKWVDVKDLREMIKIKPESFFALELPAWEYYFNQSLDE